MSSRPDFLPDQSPSELEQSLPIAYSIPFEWGGLQVTEAAHEAYGFVPLTAAAQPGSLPAREITLRPETHILLTTAEEAGIANAPPGAGFAFAEQRKKGLRVAFGLSSNVSEFSNGLISATLKGLQQELGADPEELRRAIVNQDDVPFEEAINQDMPQLLIHMMGEELDRSLREQVAEWFRADLSRQHYKQLRNIGVVALTGTGLITASQFILGGGKMTPIDAAWPGTFLLAEAELTRRMIKRHLDKANERERLIADCARKYAALVSGEIHRSYCRNHFDKQLDENIES